MLIAFMIFIFALMFLGLIASIYSAISKLKGRQSRSLHRKPDPQESHVEREIPGYPDVAYLGMLLHTLHIS